MILRFVHVAVLAKLPLLLLLLTGSLASAAELALSVTAANCSVDGASECMNYAPCSPLSGTCTPCPAGFAGTVCDEVVCGSLLNPARPPRQDLNKMCTSCDAGWGGGLCNVCLSDDACNAISPTYLCVNNSAPVNTKHTWCKVDTEIPGVDDELDVSFACSVPSASCEFQMWKSFQELFFCKLSDCSSSNGPQKGAYSTKCKSIVCQCNNNATCGEVVLSIIDSLVGSADLVCDDPSKCYFRQSAILELFENGIELSCASGECTSYQVPDITPITSTNFPLIGGLVVTGLLFIVGVVFGVQYFVHVQKSVMSGSSIALLSDEDRRLIEGRHQPTDLSFLDVSYTVNNKSVLTDISGRVKPGETMAIMGPSGAGKSSCLDILAMKSKQGVVSGRILLNGKAPNKKDFRYMVGYVDQEDTLMGTLTVRETLMYSAMLRLPRTLSMAAKQRRVDDTLTQLGITHIADSRVGSSGQRGISGGEKRRVSIGQELVTSPSIIFLDEPTSGLDSYSAFMVIECLSELAHKYSKTIIFTIHQPRSNIYRMFDKLLLLASGQVVYSGPAQEAVHYFGGIGFPCPVGFNIADFLIDVIAQGNSDSGEGATNQGEEQARQRANSIALTDLDSTALLIDNAENAVHESIPATDDIVEGVETSNRVHFLVDSFRNSQIADMTRQEIAVLMANQTEPVRVSSLRLDSLNKENAPNPSASFFSQLLILCGRTFINLYRNPFLLMAHFGISVVLAVICGSLFWQVTNDLPGVQNRLGCLFFMCALLAFGSLSSLELFASERLLFIRERSNGFYTPLAYFLSKVLFDIVPLRVFPPIVMGSIAYYMIGLNPAAEHFFQFLAVLVLFNLTAAGICLIIGALFRQTSVANLVASLTMLFSMLFGGFLLNKQNIPAFMSWIQNFSFFNYGYEALIANELNSIQLRDKSIVDIKIPGRIVLVRFGFNPDGYWSDLGYLTWMFVITMFISFACFKFLVKEQR